VLETSNTMPHMAQAGRACAQAVLRYEASQIAMHPKPGSLLLHSRGPEDGRMSNQATARTEKRFCTQGNPGVPQRASHIRVEASNSGCQDNLVKNKPSKT